MKNRFLGVCCFVRIRTFCVRFRTPNTTVSVKKAFVDKCVFSDFLTNLFQPLLDAFGCTWVTGPQHGSIIHNHPLAVDDIEEGEGIDI